MSIHKKKLGAAGGLVRGGELEDKNGKSLVEFECKVMDTQKQKQTYREYSLAYGTGSGTPKKG